MGKRKLKMTEKGLREKMHELNVMIGIADLEGTQVELRIDFEPSQFNPVSRTVPVLHMEVRHA